MSDPELYPEYAALSELLDPVAAELGFGPFRFKWVNRARTLWVAEAAGAHSDVGFREKMDFYSEDAFPDRERGEVFVHCWNSLGSGSPARARLLAAALERRGHAARVTRRKGAPGVVALVFQEPDDRPGSRSDGTGAPARAARTTGESEVRET